MDINRVEQTILLGIAVLYPWHHIFRSPVAVNLSLGDLLIGFAAILIFLGLIGEMKYPRLVVWPVLLIGAAGLSITVAAIAMPEGLGTRSISELVKLLASVAWLVVLVALICRETFKRFYQFSLASCATAITVSIWAGYHAVIVGTRRPAGPFPNPNLFADYLLLHIFLLVAVGVLALRAGHNRQIVYPACAAGILVQVIALAGTQSRSAFAALFIAAAICCPWWRIVTETRIDSHTIIPIAMVTVIGVLIISIGEWGIITRYAQAFSGEATGGRGELWKRSLSAFGQNPIFGIGYGQHPIYVDTSGLPPTTHNTTIRFIAETGVVGFAVLAGMAFAVFRQSVSLSLVDGFGHTRYLLAYFIAAAANSMFHDIINFRSFWIALALLCALLLAYQKENVTKPKVGNPKL